MAKLNILGAISTGLIEGGKAAQNYGAMKLKEEYMAAETAVASQESLMGRYKTVLDTIDSSITNNRDGVTGGIIDPDLDEDLQRGKAILVEAIMEGKALPSGSWSTILELTKTVDPELDLENNSDDDEGWLSGIGNFLKATWEDLNPTLQEIQKSLKSNLNKENVVTGPQGPMFRGTPEDVRKALGNAEEKVQAIKDWVSSITSWQEVIEPGDLDGSVGSIKETDKEKELKFRLNSVGGPTPSNTGLISEGDQAFLDQTNSAEGILNPMSTAQANVEMTEEEIAQITAENNRQQKAASSESEALNQYIGSEEAIQSLSSIGGPIGEPAGNTTFKDFVIGKPEVEVKVSSPEIEEIKSTILSNVFSAIKGTESNVMGYNAVSDTTDGDKGLTTSTVKEIIDKHGNTAVGVGQFKYKEFMKPTAKKWFGMNENQLKEQMFTPQFQDALLIAGIYDAGLQQFVDDKISVDVFQKRLANIWRGLPPTRETKEGDIVDEFENKARMSGENFRSLLLQFNAMTEGLIGAGTSQEMGQ